MLAARNTKAAADSKAAEWAHDERMAGIKANKGKDSGQIKYVQDQIKHFRGVVNDDTGMVTQSQKDDAAAQLRSLDVAHRKLSGMGEKSYPVATANDIQALHKGDVTAAAFSARFGDAGTEKARKLIADEEKETAEATRLAAEAKAKAAEAKRIASRSLDEIHPAKGDSNKGILGGAIDAVKGHFSKAQEGQRAQLKPAIEAALNRVIDATNNKKPPNEKDMEVLKRAHDMKWLTKDEKASINNAYGYARGSNDGLR